MRNFKLSFILIILFIGQSSFAAYVNIPINGHRLPSNDLVYKGEVLNPEQALTLKKNSKDERFLSKLNPFDNDLWSSTNSTILTDQLDDLRVENSETVTFLNTIQTNSKILFFNITKKSSTDTKIFTVVLEKSLHSSLLRKNLLRKMGYKIPKMKYLKNLNISFNTVKQRNDFLKNTIPQKTFGAASRWVKNIKDLNSEGNSDLIVNFQDLAVFEPSDKDHNNLAMGAPAKTLRSRTRRALAIPYALLDLKESVNKFPWVVGIEENGSIKLPYFFAFTDLYTTIDDAIWALKKLGKLNRADFIDIVKRAHFPIEAELVLVEKIISRRNYLMKLFKIKESEITTELSLPFKQNINHGKLLVDSRLMKENWKGYATRFAHGDAESPFQDFQYYFYNKIRSNTIVNLLSRVDSKLKAFKLGDSQRSFFQDEFKSGLDHFVDTGEFKEFNIGTWVSPYVNGRIIVNRDVVIGNFMGTDNMVQLADTIGFSASIGLHVGIEKVLSEWAGSARAGLSYVKTWTHLKPIRTLKQTFKEPYKNIVVPLLKMNLANQMEHLRQFKNTTSEDKKKTKEALEKILTHINNNLGIGESIILTEKIVPQALLSGKLNILGTPLSTIPVLSAGVGTNVTIIRRIHILRKDSKIIQIYDDHGNSTGVSMNMGLKYFVPVLKILAKKETGAYTLKVHNVNINTDIEKNPQLYQNANALYHLFKENSFELLSEIRKPFKLKANKFNDRTIKVAIPILGYENLKGNTYYTAETSDGRKGHYLHVTKKTQKGIGFEPFFKDTVNYYLKDFITDANVQLSNDRWKNPAHTLWGHSWSSEYSFEAVLARPENGQKMTHLPFKSSFIRIVDQNQGWKKSSKSLRRKVKKINKKFGLKLFPTQILHDTKGLKLYNIAVNINLYQGAITRIKSLTKNKLKFLFHKKKNKSNIFKCLNTQDMTIQESIDCGDFSYFVRIIKKCNRIITKKSSNKKYALCLIKLTKALKENLSFDYFVKVVGKNNLYLYATIDGFRKESEILNKTIYSNSFGRINGRYQHGPLATLVNKFGLQVGEFEGSWLREIL